MTAPAPISLPLVSIIVPMLNEEGHIAACIDGLHQQTYRGPMEILVVDGGSTDRSRVIVEEVGSRD